MKFFFLFCFFLLTFFTVAQNKNRVTIEGKINPEYKADMKKVNSIRYAISQSWEKIDEIKGTPSGLGKKQLQEWKNDNLKVREQLITSNIDAKCKEALSIQRKWSKVFTGKRYPCNSVANKLKRIDELIVEANNKIKDKFIDENDALNTENENKKLKKDLENYNKESKNLDALIKKSEEKLKSKKNKKSLSFDDFIKMKKNSKKGLNLKKQFNNPNNRSLSKNLGKSLNAKKSKSLKNLSQNNSKSLSDKLNNSLSDDDAKNNSFEIETRKGLMGVVSINGKTLIPFKKWTIKKYKYGIAEVELIVNKITICSSSITTTKKGFVDRTGKFMDGFDISISSYSYKINNSRLYIVATNDYQWNSSLSSDENIRRKKAFIRKKELSALRNKREKERKKKAAEIKRKKCKLKINNYKDSQYTKYN